MNADAVVQAFGFRLSRNASGRLVFTSATGEVFEGVVPVRAFPITSPEEGFALVTAEGRELAWIARLADLPEPDRLLVDEELAAREFLPEIRRLVQVSSFATPSTWTVETDRGPSVFVLKGEDDIRRLSHSMLLVTDSSGVHYLVRDHARLDRASRRLLDRFL